MSLYVEDSMGVQVANGSPVAANVSGRVYPGRVTKIVKGRKPGRCVIHVELGGARRSTYPPAGHISKIQAYTPYNGNTMVCDHILVLARGGEGA